MFRKISVLIPTRGRLKRLGTLLESFYATTKCGDHNAELVFRADEDDPDTIGLLSLTTFQTFVGPRHQGYQSMPQFFNELAAHATGDVLMCGNDDMIFRTPGWAAAILAAANQFPDGVFNLGVRTMNEGHYPFSIVSAIVVRELGFLWDPRIFWGDMFLRDVMMDLGRVQLLPEVRIDHDWVGFNPDSVFHESDKDITGKDPSYWSGTHRTAVNDAVTRLRGLLA